MKTWKQILRGHHAYYADFSDNLPVLAIYEEGTNPAANFEKVSFSVFMYIYCFFNLSFVLVYYREFAAAHVTLDDVYSVLAERPARPSLNRALERV